MDFLHGKMFEALGYNGFILFLCRSVPSPNPKYLFSNQNETVFCFIFPIALFGFMPDADGFPCCNAIESKG